MTIQEGNKILIDFMGWKNNFPAQYPIELHTSWEKLMCVVEKIENIETEYGGVESHILSPTWNKKIKNECFFWAGDEIRNITDTKTDSKIEAVWGACVKFIIDYNNHLTKL